MRILILAAVLGLAACSSYPPGTNGNTWPNNPGHVPLPTNGPIAYRCSDGTQLMVDFEANQARVAIVGGPSMVLPSAGSADAPYYTNGRYGFRGSGPSGQWEVGRGAPVNCAGG